MSADFFRISILSAFLMITLTSVAYSESFSSTGKILTFYVPHDAPGCRTSIEGCIETSKPGLDGQSIPRCLDEVRAGTARYVTLASDPRNYGKYYNLGTITYTSALDKQKHTVENVVGYVHDTGSAFRGRPDKLDICTTICRGCSDSQAGALAMGRNVSFTPNGQGIADNTATSPFSFANTGWSSSPVGFAAPGGTYQSQGFTPSGANYPLPAAIPASSLLTASQVDSQKAGEEQVQPESVSDLLNALAAPTSSTNAFSRIPLTLTGRIGSENASGLSAGNASDIPSGLSVSPATAPQSANTFSPGYQSTDLRWSAWNTISFFRPFFLEIEALIRDIIDLIRRL